MPGPYASQGFTGIPSALISFGIFMAFFCLTISALAFVNYLLRGIGVLNMSKNRGLSNGFLGFIPFAWRYQWGKLAGELEIGKLKIKNTGLWLLLARVAFWVAYIVTYIPFLITTITKAEIMENAQSSLFGANEEILLANFFSSIIGGMILFILVVAIAAILLTILEYIAYYKLYSKSNKPIHAVFLMLLTVMVPLAQGIIFFKEGKKIPVINAYKDSSPAPTPVNNITPVPADIADTVETVEEPEVKEEIKTEDSDADIAKDEEI